MPTLKTPYLTDMHVFTPEMTPKERAILDLARAKHARDVVKVVSKDLDVPKGHSFAIPKRLWEKLSHQID